MSPQATTNIPLGADIATGPAVAGRGYGVPDAPSDRQASWAFPPAAPPVAPQPLPKRPKGRLFVGSVLLLMLTTVVYGIWDGFLRYRVHGVVEGRVVHVSANWSGVVATVHVREGEHVDQGQPLATVRSLEREQELARTQDQLQLAQASLQARLAELKWEAQLRGDRTQQALAEYYQVWGELAFEQQQLFKAQADWQRLEQTGEQNERAVSRKQLDTARFTVAGFEAKVEKLQQAVEQLKKRVSMLDATNPEASTVLRPYVMRIENLQSEIARLRTALEQGVVRAPVNGKVVRILRFTGEFAGAAQPVLELVEDGSLEPVLYLSQDQALSLQAGDEVRIRLHPLTQPLACRVDRHGHQMQPAPSNIQRYYRKDERLLPVHLAPRSGESFNRDCLWLGCEVKLPYRWAAGVEFHASARRRHAIAITDNRVITARDSHGSQSDSLLPFHLSHAMTETTPIPAAQDTSSSRKRRRYFPSGTHPEGEASLEPVSNATGNPANASIERPHAPDARRDPRYFETRSLIAIPMRADGGPVLSQIAVGVTVDVSATGMQLLLDQSVTSPTGRWVVWIELPSDEYCYETVQMCEVMEKHEGCQLRVVRLLGDDSLFSPARCWPVFQPATGRFETQLSADVLNEWCELGVLRRRVLDRVLTCPQCGAIPTLRRGCQSCGSSHVQSARLIHHFACAHVAQGDQFDTEDGLCCPKCRTGSLVVGTDYEYLSGPSLCQDCGWSGAEQMLVGQCMGCNIRFPLESSRQQELIGYDVQRLDALDHVAAL